MTVWGCLEEPLEEGLVAELERRVAAAAAALEVVERRLAHTPVGSLAGAVAARSTLRDVAGSIGRRELRDVALAVEHLAAEMRALETGLALARRLRDGSGA